MQTLQDTAGTFRTALRAALCAAGLAALALACSSGEDEIRRAQTEVRRALARGEVDSAREALQRLRKSRPETPEGVRSIANLMVRAGEAPQALWLLGEGLERFPDRHDLRILFARIGLMLGEAARAAAALEPVDAESLFHPDALLLRARATLELGELEEALAILEEAGRLYPDLPGSYRVHAQILLEEERLEEAEEVLARAEEQTLPEEEARAMRILKARVLGMQGKTETAIEILRRVVEEDPESSTAWDLLVRALAQLNRLGEAADLLESALDQDPEQRRLYPYLANVYVRSDRPDEAEALLQRLIEISGSPSAYLELARLHLGQQNPEGMLAVVDEGLRQLPEQPMLHVARIEALLELDRVKEARVSLKGMPKGIRKRPEVEYVRGRIELAEGNAAAAAKRLRKLAPKLDRAETQLYLGLALEELGDLDGAQRRYALAQQRDPSSPTPALAILRVAEKRSDLVSALVAAQRLMRRFPRYRTLGYAVSVESLLTLEDLPQAEQMARRFRERFPGELDAWVLLSRTLWQQGRTEEAEQILADAEKRFGPQPDIAGERAFVLVESQRPESAIAILEQELKEHPDDAGLIRRLAGVHFHQGRYEAGSELVDRVLERDPNDTQALHMRLVYTVANGPLEVARRDAERYIELRPNDADAHYKLGLVCVRLGLTEQAMDAYRRAAALNERAFEPRNNLAVLLQQTGDLEGALEAAHEAYARAETDPAVLDTLGWIYFEQGLLDRSIALLEDAHQRSPEDGEPQLHLALAYRKADRTEEAQKLLSDLLSRDDADDEIRRQARDALKTP